ncbi:outer membrane beta-barrel protein [Devosia sp.]|uniref:outer membrane protein n=1 Tax=Devosia sp. TaxID=1871048 RepID=UPI003266118A
MAVSGAAAEDNTLYFSPQLTTDLTPPSFYDGLYAGVLFGPISARKNNFNTVGAEIRGEVGGMVGWNQPIAPGIVAGAELQATVATDFSSSYLRAMALARIGFYAGDTTLIYLFGGAGYMATSAAFEAGLGGETRITDTMAARLEIAGIGQIGPVPNGKNVPAISALRITGGLTWQLDGAVAPWNALPPATDFAGYYAGLNAGGLTDPNFNFFNDYGNGWHLSRFTIGTLAGVNYALNDYMRAGVEAQLDASFDTSGDVGADVLALARVGVVPMTGLMPYAAAGIGLVEGRAAYALGGGVEYALWGNTTLRGEALLLGRLDGTPGLGGGTGPSTSKVTIGTVWHFD